MPSALFLSLYLLLWVVALPFLYFSARLRQGFSQRLLPRASGPFDIWIQAASGGESYLAVELINSLSSRRNLSILVTTCTAQGMEILQGITPARGTTVEIAFFPFDLPPLISLAIKRVRPALVVLLETELWPGLLWACRRRKVPVLLVNGRMREKSLRGYRKIRPWLTRMAPHRILAVSEEYRERFSELFDTPAGLMGNIKFDRMPVTVSLGRDNELSRLITPDTPFLVLGSVREEEEEQLLEVIKGLRARHPRIVIGLFPRHLHRIPSWKRLLKESGVSFLLRSALAGPISGGYVVCWDRFGELAQAYGLCRAAFVGGTLAPLGGQNFLEPLIHGVVPCIGAHWDNFSWIGREIIHMGLVREVDNPDELVHCLGQQLEGDADRQCILARAEDYIRSRRGGTDTACQAILHELDGMGERVPARPIV
jgi:3-deoxy-D-manno-octulosonic-acid transferase